MTKKVIKAIEASIKHWEQDIVKPLKEGQKTTWGFMTLEWKNTQYKVPCYVDDCPLCQIFFWDNNCKSCPLKTCEKGSTWNKFVNKPTLKTAQAMVRKLKSLLPKEER